MAIYTHDFKIQCNSDTIEGEIEFNEDGITTYKFDPAIEEKELAKSELIDKLFKLATKFMTVFGDIETIEISKK